MPETSLRCWLIRIWPCSTEVWPRSRESCRSIKRSITNSLLLWRCQTQRCLWVTGRGVYSWSIWCLVRKTGCTCTSGPRTTSWRLPTLRRSGCWMAASTLWPVWSLWIHWPTWFPGTQTGNSSSGAITKLRSLSSYLRQPSLGPLCSPNRESSRSTSRTNLNPSTSTSRAKNRNCWRSSPAAVGQGKSCPSNCK